MNRTENQELTSPRTGRTELWNTQDTLDLNTGLILSESKDDVLTSLCSQKRCVRGSQVATTIATTVTVAGLMAEYFITGGAGYCIASAVVGASGSCTTTALGCHAERLKESRSIKIAPKILVEVQPIADAPIPEKI